VLFFNLDGFNFPAPLRRKNWECGAFVSRMHKDFKENLQYPAALPQGFFIKTDCDIHSDSNPMILIVL
jgi:hypothetical protein